MDSQANTAVSSFASEQGHYYDARTGEPCYTIVGKNGVERATTLRDARANGWVPSVTTIMQAAARPGLERWKAEQVMLAGLTLPRLDGEDEKAWTARVWEDSKQQAQKAAARGSDIHGAVEAHYAGKPYDPALAPWVDSISGLVRQEFGEQEWRPEKSFASPLGYGGKVDLHSAGVLLDFKGKEGDRGKWKVWDEHAMQLTAYAGGLEMTAKGWPTCGIIFFDRDTPYAELHEVKAPALSRGWAMFTALLDYWYAQTGLERGRGR